MTQTKQSSDGDDIDFDVWHDVFLDTKDLHRHFSRQNYYGPVLFKFSIKCLIEEEIDVWITKDNPINWSHEMSMEDKYFQSVEELERDWDQYDLQRKMVTIRKPGRPVLFNHLKSVVLDNPAVRIGDTSLKKESRKAISNATKGNSVMRDKLKARKCHNCYCKSNYLDQVSRKELRRLFLHPDHERFYNNDI